LGYLLFKNLDKGIIEWIGPMLVVSFVTNITKIAAKKYRGLIDHYIFIMVLGLLIIIMFVLYLEIWIYDLKLFCIVIVLILLEVYKKK